MTDTITLDIFEHLVLLAALELDPEEAVYLRRELNHQLAAIHELEAIPLDADIPVSLHGVSFTPEISPELRSDEWVAYENAQGIIKQAPQKEDGYIVVPDIPHTDLE